MEKTLQDYQTRIAELEAANRKLQMQLDQNKLDSNNISAHKSIEKAPQSRLSILEETPNGHDSQYRQIFETVTDGLSIINLETQTTVAMNPAYHKIHGYSYDEFITLSPNKYIHPDFCQLFHQLIGAVQSGHRFTGQATDIHKNGSSIELDVKGIPFTYQGKPYALCILRDITQRVRLEAERDRQEQALRAIVEGTATQTGETFFRACVKHLAAALGVRYAIISKVIQIDGQPSAQTLAFWNDSDFGDNFVYGLNNTPCLETLQTHAICRYPSAVQSQFPNVPPLMALNAESYVGMPILNSGGDFLGFFAVVDVEPMAQHSDLQTFILEIFAARAGAEIERIHVEQALIASNKQIKQQAQQDRLLNQIAHQIRISLDLECILNTTVREISRFLGIDRCHFAWYVQTSTSRYWDVIAEVQAPGLPSFLGQHPTDRFGELTDALLQQQTVQIDDIASVHAIQTRDFLASLGYKSVLMLPIRAKSDQLGIIACIQAQSLRRWQPDEVEFLQAVVAQLAIALNQAELLVQSEARATELERLLIQLQQTQSHLVQSEKMSSLGQMVAGVAHEINNPMSFIYGNLNYAQHCTQRLMNLIDLYKQHYPQTPPEIQKVIHEIELDFLRSDLPKMFKSMEVGADRICEIIKSLRTFSRLDEAEVKDVDIHDGIDSSLTILETRLRAQNWRPSIQVIKHYGTLPHIECYPGPLNQVFMNILCNAIDALEEKDHERSWLQMESLPSTIWIQTELVEPYSDQFSHPTVSITIRDNGSGMSSDTKNKLFNPFFTTKPVGRGTGLGLSISYQIITETHGGTIECQSKLGSGSIFTIHLPLNPQAY